VSEDSSVPIHLTGSDGDGDPLQFFIEVGPAHGTLAGSGANRTYTPFANYFGSDSFEFSVRDPSGRSDRAVVSITVEEVSGVPTTLVAQPATVGTIPPRIVKPMEAKLTRTSDAAPLAGRTIEFYTGNTRHCAVKTNASGVAKCSPSPSSLLLASSYQARFAGDEDYAASSSSAAINKVR
jgi:hypothetical protein